MAFHVSDWENSLNQCCAGNKRYTIVMIIVEIVVLVLNRIPALFLLHKSYSAGVFVRA
jgi:hypothetical protein